MLSLVYTFEASPKQLNPDRILGVDLGVVNAAYMAVSDDAYWRKSITGGQIEKHRRTVEVRKQKMSRQAAVCGQARVGHGYTKRMRTVEKIGDKIARFRDNINKIYAVRIVYMAVRKDCGVIQMEDLTGIAEDSVFLGRWTYYDLQQRIEQKAREHGIEVRKITPNWTSLRCSECGYIARKNRKKADFECVQCGYKIHADFNAARNIATPNIEEIIRDKCKTLNLPYDKENFVESEEELIASTSERRK